MHGKTKEKPGSPSDRRPRDPLLRGADAALRRAAVKAQQRAQALGVATDGAANKIRHREGHGRHASGS